ncbi:hypothetical protein FRB99_002039 [Tulasnella sp. 403]|nr:hypothetical protein FRB99_002039 [Tulasnella sp. 403]
MQIGTAPISRSKSPTHALSRTHTLVRALKDGIPAKGRTFDFLYVDEVQDNLLIDFALLRKLCPNPHGIFFAGDTAQTISAGSAFRFKDLEMSLQRMEMADPLVKARVRTPVTPQFFELSTNYRSHDGIVQAAKFLVDLLTLFFPNSLDVLTPESAKVTGPKPVFFLGRLDNDPNLCSLIQEKSTGNIEFGAEQAIIVRNEDDKKRLPKKIRESAIILTVYESKGMEFNDVLLYNFFYSSSCTTKDWEAAARALADPSTFGMYYRPFDRYRYAILQSELKTLYVGLTRARERVWLWDISDKGTILKMLLHDRGLCTARETYEEVPQVAVWSSEDQWAKQARDLFSKRLYEQAAFCFSKAEMPWWRDVTIAYGERQEAQKIPVNDPRRRQAFQKAACQFRAHASKASTMLDRLMLYTNAARCFVEAQEHHQAAECFAASQKYNDALWHYKIAKSFDEGLELISLYPSEVDSELVESFKYMAKIVFTTKQREDTPENVEYLRKAASICGSPEEYISFLDDHGFTKQLAVYLDKILGKHKDAAEVYEQVSAHTEAVAQWVKADDNAARERAASSLLGGLRREVPYGTNYKEPTQQVVALLDLASTVQAEDTGVVREINMYRALFSGDSQVLNQLAMEYHKERNVRCTLLCFDAWSHIVAPDGVGATDINDVISVLLGYLEYYRALRFFTGSISRDRRLMGTDGLFAFLGFHTDNQDGTFQGSFQRAVHVCVLPRSFIYAQAASGKSDDTPTTIPVVNAVVLIKKVLVQKCNAMLETMHKAALESSTFNLCDSYMVTGRCKGLVQGQEACKRGHPNSSTRTLIGFNEHVRVHLLLIAVLDHVAVLSGTKEEHRTRRGIQRYPIRVAGLHAQC